MAKGYIFDPWILLSGDEGGSTVIGGGTGQGTSNPFPMSYAEWLTSGFQYGYDFDEDGVYSIEEFAYWWEDQHFTMEQWGEYNPGVDWPL